MLLLLFFLKKKFCGCDLLHCFVHFLKAFVVAFVARFVFCCLGIARLLFTWTFLWSFFFFFLILHLWLVSEVSLSVNARLWTTRFNGRNLSATSLVFDESQMLIQDSSEMWKTCSVHLCHLVRADLLYFSTMNQRNVVHSILTSSPGLWVQTLDDDLFAHNKLLDCDTDLNDPRPGTSTTHDLERQHCSFESWFLRRQKSKSRVMSLSSRTTAVPRPRPPGPSTHTHTVSLRVWAPPRVVRSTLRVFDGREVLWEAVGDCSGSTEKPWNSWFYSVVA